MFKKGGLVEIGVVRFSLLPASEVNADEFEGQGADCGVMFFGSALLRVIGPGPGFGFEGLTGVFVKALPSELGAAVAHVDGLAFAAGFPDRSDAKELLEILGAGEAVTLGAKGHQQAGSQGGTRPGKAAKKGRVGMGVKGFLDFLIENGDGRMEALEHGRQALHLEAGGKNQSRVGGQRLGCCQSLQAGFHFFAAATVMGMEEGPHFGGAGFLQRSQGGPFFEKGGRHGDRQVVQKDFSQGIIHFKFSVQLVDQMGAGIDQAAALLHQAGQLTGQGRVRAKRLELIQIMTEVLFQQPGIGSIVFGPADPKALAVTGQGLGIDWKDGDKVVFQQCGNDRPSGGFDGEGHGLIFKPGADLSHPVVQRLGLLLQENVFGLAQSGGLQPKIVMRVGPVQADGGGEFILSLHGIVFASI